MICYKGNSFFRNIEILIKDFDEKVKKTFQKKSIKFCLLSYKKTNYLYKTTKILQ